MQGRRTVTDTRPGQVLSLALVANAPVAYAFILVPLVTREAAGMTAMMAVAWLTPLFAAASLFVFSRASPDARMHRAARIGRVLAVTGLLLWLLVVIPLLRA